MVEITDDMIDSHEAEWERWGVRKNKSSGTAVYEVFRGPVDDEQISDGSIAIVETYPGDHDWAHYRMERLRIEAAMKAALVGRFGE